MSEEICDYVATKYEPETWHGKESRKWGLDFNKDRGGLDIEEWRCPHPSIEGKDRCIFHTDSDELPEEIDESEALLDALNEAGESPFDDGEEHRGQFVGATFGSLDLSGETIIVDEHSLRLDHAKIHGFEDDLMFEGTEFVVREQLSFYRTELVNEGMGDVVFDETGFTVEGEGNVSFKQTKFITRDSGKVSFDGAKFTAKGKGSVFFNETEFTTKGGGDVSFDGAEFATEDEGNVSFTKTAFTTKGGGDISFTGAEFTTEGQGNASFGHMSPSIKEAPRTFGGVEFIAEGDGNVLFNNTRFTPKGDGDVSFGGARFTTKGQGNVSFRGANFTTKGSGNVSFDGSEFTTKQGKVSFDSTEFATSQGSISFWGAEFYADKTHFQDASFRAINIEGISDSNFPNGQIVDCASSQDSGKVLFKEAKFTGDLIFKDIALDSRTQLSFSATNVAKRFIFEVDVDDPVIPAHFDFSKIRFTDPPIFRSKKSTFDSDSVEVIEQYFPCVFVGSVDFSDAQFPEGTDFSDFHFTKDTTFAGANLSGVNFSRADLSGTSLERATLNRAELLGTNLIGAKLYGALLGDARINHRTNFWPTYNASTANKYSVSATDILSPGDSPIPNHIPGFRGVPLFGGGYAHLKAWLRQGSVPYCRYDPRYETIDDDNLPGSDNSESDNEDDEVSSLEKAAEVYGTVEGLAHDNSLQELASESFIGRKDVQRRQYWRDDEYGRRSLMWFRSFVPNVIARYGESPWRVLGFGAFTILVCGLLYSAFDLITEVGSEGDPATLLESVYFSALTFTTLGYGDFRPTNTVGQIIAVSETATGVIMLAILVFVFGRRATR